ncbi:flavodoxin family protein [Desulfobacterales bacterium HSG16]|nr:flavodoxin family protein [Desulfobacterales bacterium HSG16]
MKSLVVYSSQTGNTKKLADAVFETLTGEKEIHLIKDAPAPDEFDLVAVGFWTMAGKPDPKSSEYLEKIGEKSLFLFATHGAAKESDHAKNAMNHAKNLAPKAKIVGMYNCQGEVNPAVLEKVRAKPEPPVWLTDAPDAVTHPDKSDIDKLKRLVSASGLE